MITAKEVRVSVRMHIIALHPDNNDEALRAADGWADTLVMKAWFANGEDIEKTYQALQKQIRISHQYDGTEILDDDDLPATHVAGCPGYIYCHCGVGAQEERARRRRLYQEQS
jgi:hypothetical protein